MSTDYRETDGYKAAQALAAKAHRHQVDKGGAPYIEHLERVADRLVRRWPDATPAQIQIALLHDIIEDGQISGTEFAHVQISAGLHHRIPTLSDEPHGTASSLSSRLNCRRIIRTLQSRETP